MEPKLHGAVDNLEEEPLWSYIGASDLLQGGGAVGLMATKHKGEKNNFEIVNRRISRPFSKKNKVISSAPSPLVGKVVEHVYLDLPTYLT